MKQLIAAFLTVLSFTCKCDALYITTDGISEYFHTPVLSRFIGAQQCAMQGEMVLKKLDDGSCEETNKYFYLGKVVLIEGLYTTKKDVFVVDGVENYGCSWEQRVMHYQNAGAIAVVSYWENQAEPGLRYNTASLQNNAFYIQIPLLQAAEDFTPAFERLLVKTNDTAFNVTLTCDEENEYVTVLNVFLPIMMIVLGLLSFRLAMIAFQGCKQLKLDIDRTAAHRGSDIAVGQYYLLAIEGFSMTCVGFTLCVGGAGPTSHSILGDTVITYEFKTIGQSLFTGIGFFSTVGLALLWRETEMSLRRQQAGGNVFRKYRWLLVVCFALAVIPDLFFGLDDAKFGQPAGFTQAGAGFYLLVNIGVGVYFKLQVNAFIKHLRSTIKQTFMMNESKSQAENRIKMNRFAMQMSGWLWVFQLFLTMQVATLFLFVFFRVFSPWGTFFFASLMSLSRIGMSMAKIMGIKPSNAKRRSSVSSRPISSAVNSEEATQLSTPGKQDVDTFLGDNVVIEPDKPRTYENGEVMTVTE